MLPATRLSRSPASQPSPLTQDRDFSLARAVRDYAMGRGLLSPGGLAVPRRDPQAPLAAAARLKQEK